jgi:hypothetical protein
MPPQTSKNIVDLSDYRVGGLYGIHFTKHHFSLVSKYYLLLDAFQETEELTAWGVDGENLRFAFGPLEIEIDLSKIVIRSGLRLNQSLQGTLKSPDGEIHIPSDLANTYKMAKLKTSSFEQSFDKNERQTFQIDAAGIVDALIKVVGALVPIRFVGYVESYLFSLQNLSWNVLDRFDKGLEIEGAERGEKIAINRYDFLNSQDQREKSLIFKVTRIPKSEQNPVPVSYAMLDYQKWFQEGQTIEELNGPKTLFKDLMSGLEEIIDKEHLLELKTIK